MSTLGVAVLILGRKKNTSIMHKAYIIFTWLYYCVAHVSS